MGSRTKIKNGFMGGPFVSNVIVDSLNNRTIFLYGFIFNPGKTKRNDIQEFEATFKSLKALATLTSFFRSGGSKMVSTTMVFTCGIIDPSA